MAIPPKDSIIADELADITEEWLKSNHSFRDMGISLEETAAVLRTLSEATSRPTQVAFGDLADAHRSLSYVEQEICQRFATMYPVSYFDVTLAFRVLGSFDRLTHALELSSLQNCTVLHAAETLKALDKACTCDYCGKVGGVNPATRRCLSCKTDTIKQPEFRMIR